MILGLVIKRSKRKSIFSAFEKNIKYESFYFCGIKLCVAKIKDKKHNSKNIKKAAKKLFAKCDNVFADKKICGDIKNFDDELLKKLCFAEKKDEKKLFLTLAAKLYLYVAKIQNKKPQRFKTIIQDENLCAADLNFLKEFCFFAQNIKLKTNSKYAEELANLLFKETGCVLQIKSFENAQNSAEFSENQTVLINVDKGFLKFEKNAFFDKFSFGTEEICKKLESDPLWLCAVLNKCKKLPEIKNISGRCAYFEFEI